MLIAKVIVPVPLEKTFDYLVGNKNLKIGNFVKVQFGRTYYIGLVENVLEIEKLPDFNLKEITEILGFKPLSEENLDFIKWVSDYNLIPIGMVFKFILPINLFESSSKEIKTYTFQKYNNEKLTQKQKQLLDFFNENKDYCFTENEIKKQLNIGVSVINTLLKFDLILEKKEKAKKYNFKIDLEKVILNKLTKEQDSIIKQIRNYIIEDKKSILLEGETGSGKTEIYFHLIKEYLEKNENNQVLFLVPEIALTSQLIDRLNKQFNSDVAIWHSDISNTEKREIWQGILENEIKIVVGARSALFLPFDNLSIIILDEEHDNSYKQVDNGCYNARDMAVLKAKINNIPIILGSATPSLETLMNVENKKYQKVYLKNRFGNAILPEINIVDLKQDKLKKNSFISSTLKNAMYNELEKNNQVLLFLNRRGYSPLILCKECGFKFSCPNCSCALTNHKSKNKLICHQCGYSRDLPTTCPSCKNENSIISFGIGVEKIEEEVNNLFPNKKTAIITSDTISNINKIKEVLNDIIEKKIDIIMGTQIITKGYHFPDLTLVGILDADAGLFGGQFRAIEKTYQSLTQVIGRAGRAEKEGKAIIQTYSPENIIVQAIKNNNKNSILDFDKQNRELMGVYPFGKMAVILLYGIDEEKVYKKIKELLSIIPASENIEVLGPAPAILLKLNKNYRYKIIIKTKNNINIQKLIRNILENIDFKGIKFKIDINPYDIP